MCLTFRPKFLVETNTLDNLDDHREMFNGHLGIYVTTPNDICYQSIRVELSLQKCSFISM